jgi:hypothetical protein
MAYEESSGQRDSRAPRGSKDVVQSAQDEREGEKKEAEEREEQ